MAKSNAREKFIELAEKRVSRALKDIQLIGNLSNRSNYSYSKDDAQKIHKALAEALEEMKGRFARQANHDSRSFKL